jgi:hypothetical protein
VEFAMFAGLGLKVVWCDDHILEVEAVASNGGFSGTIRIYANLDFNKELADKFEGLPSTPLDRREFLTTKVGELEGLKLKLTCDSGTGLITVEVTIQCDRH